MFDYALSHHCSLIIFLLILSQFHSRSLLNLWRSKEILGHRPYDVTIFVPNNGSARGLEHVTRYDNLLCLIIGNISNAVP